MAKLSEYSFAVCAGVAGMLAGAGLVSQRGLEGDAALRVLALCGVIGAARDEKRAAHQGRRVKDRELRGPNR